MTNDNPRVQLTDTTVDVFTKLSEGNPGAMTALLECYTDSEEIDPDNAMGPLGTVLAFDTHGIYGSRIWMLYKDVCRENVNATMGILRAVQMGIISDAQMDHAIDNYGDGLNVPNVLKALKKELPNFDVGELADTV